MLIKKINVMNKLKLLIIYIVLLKSINSSYAEIKIKYKIDEEIITNMIL